jgi:hypothetical protein
VYNGEVWNSYDYGSNWTLTASLPVISVTMSANGQYQFLGTANTQMYGSSNFGSNWVVLSNSPSYPWVELTTNQSGSEIIALGYNQGIYKISVASSSSGFVKTFVIDHPTDPARHLVHACLEGPEAGVYYRGESAIEDGKISVVIELPHYASHIASNFTVQITPIMTDESIVIPTFATSRVAGNKFTVYGAPGTKFYWHVTGRRQEIDVEPLRSAVTINGEGPYRYIS